MWVKRIEHTEVERHDRFRSRTLGKARRVGHVHVVAHAVDGEKCDVDMFGQIGKDLTVIKRIPRDVIGLSLDRVLDHNADGVGIAVCRLDSRELKPSK